MQGEQRESEFLREMRSLVEETEEEKYYRKQKELFRIAVETGIYQKAQNVFITPYHPLDQCYQFAVQHFREDGFDVKLKSSCAEIRIPPVNKK